MRHVQNSNECLRKIFEDGPLGVAIVDQDNRFLEVNQKLCEMVAYTEWELGALVLGDITHPDDVGRSNQFVQQLLSGEIPSYQSEQRCIKKTGETLWVNLIASYIDEQDNALLMFEDIAERKRLEIEYERLHQQVTQAEYLVVVGRCTSGLSHEINNSMQVVQGVLSLALEELDDPVELTSYLNLSLTESAKVVQLLTRLRYVFSPQAEPLETVDLNQLLQETITLVRRELGRQNVTLQTNLAFDLPSITTKSGQLYLSFLSLLFNLGDAMSIAGGGELHLHSYILSHTVGIKFSIDIAIGPIANEPHIAETDEWQKKIVADLGLTFSRDIVIALGGDMRLGQQNGGIICSIEFPLSMSDVSTDQGSSKI
jgi:PAS domain S-box-containing protein